MVNKVLSAALFYAKMGWHVFPCVPNGKTPLTSNGLHDATTDEATIRKWFTANPNANLAINCGKSGLAVVDLDMKNNTNGVMLWEAFCETYDVDRNTTRAFTPSGGQHIFYKGSVKNSASKIAPGVDTRGEGGYVVAAPSTIDGKSYHWDKSSPREQAPLPAMVTTALAEKKRPAAAVRNVAAGSLLELVQADGFSLNYRSNQHEGSCPWCGGTDRFVVGWDGEGRDGMGRFHCRQCGADGDSVEWLIRWRGMKPAEAKLARGVKTDAIKPVAAPSPAVPRQGLDSVLNKIKSRPQVKPSVRCADCASVWYKSTATTEELGCDSGVSPVTLEMVRFKIVKCDKFMQRIHGNSTCAAH